MRIVFMGSGAFAVPALKELTLSGYEVPLVVVCRETEKPGPLERAAEELGIPVFSSDCPMDALEEKLHEVQPDMIVAAGFDTILPRAIIRLPQFGCIGLHPSLLPRWRGPAPIENALLAGDEKVGISVFYMDEGIDSGPIISKTSVPVNGKDADYLAVELAYLGAQMLSLALQTLFFSVVRPEYQDETQATYAPRLKD